MLRVEDAETAGGDWDEIMRNERINRTLSSCAVAVWMVIEFHFRKVAAIAPVFSPS